MYRTPSVKHCYCYFCYYYYVDFLLLPQEKRIYDLKKKNQELEKFKFVLDYKIKELRKQMEPRENEIKRMKDQIEKVGGSLVLVSSLLHSF